MPLLPQQQQPAFPPALPPGAGAPLGLPPGPGQPAPAVAGPTPSLGPGTPMGAPAGPALPGLGVMGAPDPTQVLSPAMKAMYLQAATSAMAGALANLHNPAGAAGVTQTDAPAPPTLDQSYA